MKITQIRADLLRLLIISEPTILSKLSMRCTNNKDFAKNVQICEDGTICIYYGKGPLWWQRLFDCYEKIGLIEIAIKIADAITGSNSTRNEFAFDSITKSILDEAIKKQDFDCVIDILFDSMRNCGDGALHSKYINQENIRKYAKEKKIETKFNIDDTDLFGFCGIEVNPGHVIPLRLGRIRKK